MPHASSVTSGELVQAGNVYVADGTIRKITSTGKVTTVADQSNGVNQVSSVTVDLGGNIYALNLNADSSYSVLKITPSGAVSVMASSDLALPVSLLPATLKV